MIPFSAEDISVFSFTGVYEAEDFWREHLHGADASRFFDLTSLTGTDGYLSDEARTALEQVIDRLYPAGHASGDPLPRGIHFLDSGNTHYMTRLLTARLHGPYGLVLFDHHPDMQPPAFGALLSCGSWLREALDQDPGLAFVIMAGADAALAEECRVAEEPRITLLSGLPEDPSGAAACLMRCAKECAGRVKTSDMEGAVPLYLSVDKDVLSGEVLVTNWDQGEMTAEALFACIRALTEAYPVLGIDVCGECSCSEVKLPGNPAVRQNDDFNAKLLDILIAHQ